RNDAHAKAAPIDCVAGTARRYLVWVRNRLTFEVLGRIRMGTNLLGSRPLGPLLLGLEFCVVISNWVRGRGVTAAARRHRALCILSERHHGLPVSGSGRAQNLRELWCQGRGTRGRVSSALCPPALYDGIKGVTSDAFPVPSL